MIAVRPSVVIPAILASAAWWLASWVWPSPLNADAAPIRQILALMGLLYLVAGITCFLRYRNSWTLLFLFYCCCTAVHWAGPLGGGETAWDIILFCFYTLFASAFFGSLFLNLALAYPNRKLKRWQLGVIYLPVGLTALGSVLVFVTSLDINSLLPLFVIGSLFGVAGGVVWLKRLWLDRCFGFGSAANLMLGTAMLLGWLPNAVVQGGLIDLGMYNGATNLSLLLILGALCWLALSSRELSLDSA